MDANLKLSADELALVENAGLILTKNAIIQKAIRIFGNLTGSMGLALEDSDLPLEIKKIAPKLSRGENYKGLPYLMLDCPRLFEKEDILAIRSFFWWGNYFSITLHLKGKYKQIHSGGILAVLSKLTESAFCIASTEEEWQHELKNHYTPLSGINPNEFRNLIGSQSFLKITWQAPLSEWENIESILLEKFKILMEILANPI